MQRPEYPCATPRIAMQPELAGQIRGGNRTRANDLFRPSSADRRSDHVIPVLLVIQALSLAWAAGAKVILHNLVGLGTAASVADQTTPVS